MQSLLDSQELSLVPDGRCQRPCLPLHRHRSGPLLSIHPHLDGLPWRNHLEVPPALLGLSQSQPHEPHLSLSVHARVVQFTLPRELSFQPNPRHCNFTHVSSRSFSPSPHLPSFNVPRSPRSPRDDFFPIYWLPTRY